MNAKHAMYGMALLTLGMLGYGRIQQVKLQQKYSNEIKAVDPNRYNQILNTTKNLPSDDHFKIWKEQYSKMVDSLDSAKIHEILKKDSAAKKAYFEASLKLQDSLKSVVKNI